MAQHIRMKFNKSYYILNQKKTLVPKNTNNVAEWLSSRCFSATSMRSWRWCFRPCQAGLVDWHQVHNVAKCPSISFHIGCSCPGSRMSGTPTLSKLPRSKYATPSSTRSCVTRHRLKHSVLFTPSPRQMKALPAQEEVVKKAGLALISAQISRAFSSISPALDLSHLAKKVCFRCSKPWTAAMAISPWPSVSRILDHPTPHWTCDNGLNDWLYHAISAQT